MILVLLGTQNNSFYRLLEEVEKNIKNGVIKEEVIVQAGHTKFESEKMKIFDLIPGDELEKLQDEARVIITHGGVGSIISSLKKNKKVIAIPRKVEFKEHVNDHQIQIVKRFSDDGYIIGLEDVKYLENALEGIDHFYPKKYKANNKKMLNIIETFIDGL